MKQIIFYSTLCNIASTLVALGIYELIIYIACVRT
jgi:hypothetical protein